MEREIFFSTSQLEVGKPYDIELVLRLERGHRYRSLPLGVTFESPDRQISTKVVQIPLQHQRVKTGGYSIVEQLVPLEHGVSFSKEGVYTYSIRHLSTDSVIPGVIEVGLIIEPVK